MVYDFVKKMHSELLNEKMELEYEHTKIKNELEQNQRFLEKIMQEEQETYDIFSPRRKNYKLKENIKSLKQKQDGLKKSDEEIRKKLLLLSQKVNDCEKAIKQKKTRKNMVLEPEFNKTKDLAKKDKEEVYEANKNTAINNTIKCVIQKVELCSHLLLVDSNRCRLELNEIKKILLEMKEQLECEDGSGFDKEEHEWGQFDY